VRRAAGSLTVGHQFEPKVVSKRFVEDKVTLQQDFLPALLLFRVNNHVTSVAIYSFTRQGTHNGTSRGRRFSKTLKVLRIKAPGSLIKLLWSSVHQHMKQVDDC
jgi:hypothetical protein